MQPESTFPETFHRSFLIDLLCLNLHLTEKEEAAPADPAAHEFAMTQIRTLGERR